jgi:phage-related protein
VAGPIRIAILADAAPAVRGMHQVEQSATGMGSKLGGVGRGIAAGFATMGTALAAAGIVEGFKTVIDQAASLSAAIGTTKTIFKGASADMLSWSKTTATTLGISQAEALNATKVFGGFFTGVGMGTKAAADMSKNWATMAANMSAFGDIPVAESLDAVRSALIGEYDPIQKLIPTLSAASLQQKAMELSGKKNAKALTDQDKAAALNAIMTESMANKVGLAERKQRGYGVQMDVLKAQLKDAAGAIGSVFLPALTGGMAFINDTAIPAVKKLGEFLGPKLKAGFDALGGFKPPKAIVDVAQSSQVQSILDNAKNGFMSLGPVIKNALAVVMPIITAVASTLSGAFTKALPQIKAIFGTVGEIVGQAFAIIKAQISNWVALVQLIWQTFGANILAYISTAFASVVTALQGFFNIIKGVFNVIIGVLTGDWGKAWDGVKGIVSGTWQLIQGIFGLMMAGVTLLGQFITRGLSAAWSIVASVAVAAWNGIKALLVAAWNGIKSAVTSAMSGIASAIAAIWAGIKSAIVAVVSGIGAAIVAGWNAVKAATSAAWAAVSSATTAAWNAIKAFITGIWPALKGAVSAGGAAIRGAISAAWDAVKSATVSAWNAVRSAVTTGIGNVITTVKSLPGKVKSAVSGAIGWLVDVGRQMIQGLIAGIGQMASQVASKAREVVSGAVNAAKSALGMASPSKVFMEIGRLSVQGMVDGLETGKKDLIKTTEDLAKAVIKAFPTSVKKTFAKGTKLSVIEAWKKSELAAGKKRATTKNALLDRIAKDNATLQDLAGKRDAAAKGLKDANDNIAELQQARAGVVSAVADAITGSFRLVQKVETQGISAIGDLLDQSRAAQQQAEEFAGGMTEALQAKGVGPEVLKAIAAAKPTEALETARVLLAATGKELQEINKSFAEKNVKPIDDMLQRSRDALAQATEFADGLKALAGRGLPPDMLHDLATAGPAAGLETARALMAASADQVAELSKNYADIAATGQAAGEVVAGHMYDTGIAMAKKTAEGFASQQAFLEASILQIVADLNKKINAAVAGATPKVPAVAVKKGAVAAPKKGKAVPATTTAGNVTVTVNTGTIVDKRGMVDTISSAFNEVSSALGRPISMNVG